jgi:3-isopropylmalate/(R)-2-methylmalate dehydratase small subunit
MNELFQRIEENEGCRLTVDLEQQIVTDEKGLRFPFTLDPFRRECLLKGLDDIGLTLVHEPYIAAFEKKNLRHPVMYEPVDVKFHKQPAH